MLKPPDDTMRASGTGPDERPISEIVRRMIDEGKDYARAEVGLVKATAMIKAKGLKLPAMMIAIAVLFAQAAIVVLCVGGFLALLPVMGPLLAAIVATVIALGIAGLLVFAAVNRLKGAQ